jgi:hypothetical protein
MMPNGEQFPFYEADKSLEMASSLPYLPLALTYHNRSLATSGLLDTGATVNVLPYEIGVNLGAIWEEQIKPVRLTGNLALWGMVQNRVTLSIVTPAKAGVQKSLKRLDSRFRGNDVWCLLTVT